MRMAQVILWALVLPSLWGCQTREPESTEPEEAPVVTDRIPVPPEVISNIGITFKTARRGSSIRRCAAV